MNILQQYLNKFRATWSSLSTPLRLAILVVATIFVVSASTVIYFTTATEYELLASGLPPDEASAIVAHLDTANIPYRLESGGSTILVPKDRHAKARVELAGQGGLSRGGKGFELFDDASLAMTPFVQNVNYTRALQAELARSVMNLEPVASARVIIARSEPSPFIRDQQPTTASVVLKLKPGATISRQMAGGIVSLVARSVEGLKPENVTVVDAAGRLIIDPRSENGDGAASSQLEFRRDLETYLAAKAEELLSRHLGPGRALVRVSADLNQQKMKELRESYAADERVARSEMTSSSDSSPASEAKGAAGTSSNTGRTRTANSGSVGNRSREEKTSTDYLVPKTTRVVEGQPGMVQRLTVAVMVDLTPPKDSGGEAAKLISVTEVEELVKQAVGFQTGRDEIKVTNGSLAVSPIAVDGAAGSWFDQIQTYVHLVRNVSLMIAFVLLAGTVLLLVRRLASMPAGVSSAAGAEAYPSAALNGQSANGHAAPGERQQLTELANTDPRQVARVLSNLLRANGAN